MSQKGDVTLEPETGVMNYETEEGPQQVCAGGLQKLVKARTQILP